MNFWDSCIRKIYFAFRLTHYFDTGRLATRDYSQCDHIPSRNTNWRSHDVSGFVTLGIFCWEC